MSTPSNFYKNSAYSYAREFDVSSVLENLHGYRVATGEVPYSSASEFGERKDGSTPNTRINGTHSRLDRHDNRTSKRFKRDYSISTASSGRGSNDCNVAESHVGDSSHESHLRRTPEKDATTPGYGAGFVSQGSQPSGRVTSLMGYDPYHNTSGEPPPQRQSDKDLNGTIHITQDSGLIESAPNSNDVIKLSCHQRFAGPGEPLCCRCGRYGEYICDETGDDVCSMECKEELLHTKVEELGTRAVSFVTPNPPTGALQIPEMEPDRWDFQKHRWTNRQSSLSSFRCWKCSRPGHLPEDCTATLGIVTQTPADPTCFQVNTREMNGNSVSAELRLLYRRCKQLEADGKSECKSCGRHSNLAACIDCSGKFCDSEGHLTRHLLENPQHRQLYSFKLKRMVKCCKGTCAVTDARELFACHFCFNKAFDKYYSMYNATWQGAGLKLICNAVCCDDHFQWHRMNCENADVEESAYLISRDGSNLRRGQLSEFLF